MDYEPSVILGGDQVRLISKFFRKMFKINGFLVTAYPLDEKVANNLIRRYKK